MKHTTSQLSSILFLFQNYVCSLMLKRGRIVYAAATLFDSFYFSEQYRIVLEWS